MFCLTSSNCYTNLDQQYNLSAFFYISYFVLSSLIPILLYGDILILFSLILFLNFLNYSELILMDTRLLMAAWSFLITIWFFSIFIAISITMLMLSLRNSIEFFFMLENWFSRFYTF